MQAPTRQLRVTLPAELQDFLAIRANKFGLSMSSYVKTLIINDVKDMEIPLMEASEKTEKSYKIAIKNRNKAIKVDTIDEFFDTL